MSAVSEAATTEEKPKRKIFKPDWVVIRELVITISVHCTDIAALLEVRRQTLEKHCQKTFGKPFRHWASDVRRQAKMVSQFSPQEYKILLRAYHDGSLANKDRHDGTANKLRHIKSPKAPSPFGATTAPPLTIRFTYYQIDRVWLDISHKFIDIAGHQASAAYVLRCWLDPSHQSENEHRKLFDENSNIDGGWRITPVGVSAISQALILFHKELESRYLKSKNKDS